MNRNITEDDIAEFISEFDTKTRLLINRGWIKTDEQLDGTGEHQLIKVYNSKSDYIADYA